MSAVAGCYWFDAKPASPDDLRESIASVRHRSRRPFATRCAGPVALAYAPDTIDDLQPSYDASTRTTVVVDGRIDNLEDVSVTLGVASRLPAAVALAAWRKWGIDAGWRLLGDFVVIVSDESAHRMTCLRDPTGQRPLFYGRGECAVVIGSEPQQIVRHPAIRATPNEAMVGEYLTADPVTVMETLWLGVYRLPPAHALEISPREMAVRRFWDFDPEARVRHRSPCGYAEQFRDVFTTAVECRLRDGFPAGVFLSGGIDSSSVAGVAQALQRKAGRPPIHAFTLGFPGQPCDEMPYSRAVVDMWQLRSAVVNAAPPSIAEVERYARRHLDVPPYPNSLMADPLRSRAAEMGTRTLLTGFGGDDYFTGTVAPAFLLKEGRPIAWSRAVISPLLSERSRRWLRPLFGARSVRRPWIRQEFARRICLDDRLRPAPAAPFPTREQQEIHRAMHGLVQILGDEMEDRASHAAGVDQRHPLYDRRVAEFGLAVPPSQRADASGIKVVMRRALADVLPPIVAGRTALADKAEFSSTYPMALEAIGGRTTFSRLRLEEAGWVNGDVVRQMYEEMIRLYSRGGEAYISLIGPLWAVASLEQWLTVSGRLAAERSSS